MGDILREIFENKKKELISAKEKRPLNDLLQTIKGLGSTRDFQSAFRPGRTSIIAEIKFRSPSSKVENFRPGATVPEIARMYESGGARAISVLTDEKYFSGHIRYLNEARNASTLPILRKDFILDPYQVHEARVFGADAFLLIADYLDRDSLKILLETGRELGLAALVEVHSQESLEKILGLPFALLGINNRDLKTLKVDPKTTLSLLEKNKDHLRDKIVISESGIESREEVVEMERNGVRGFLIGTSLMKSQDPALKLKELTGF
ncbi:MAG: indole-3-glycerol phosphate synthase TrpC [Nitrospinae bacterium]|nr:indole-3-glycerol phosphate synthase TrpC [Nitrospinota bacterium]